jgi:type II secretion system protein J
VRSRSSLNGFTLVELVIGAAVLSGVLLAAYLTLEAGLKSDDVLAWRRDASQGARAALALLAADLRSACRLSDEIDLIGIDRDVEGIEADNIDFGTRAWRPQGPGESDFAETSWYVKQDPDTLELGLWRRKDPTPDLEPLAGGRTEEVLAPIAGFRLEYHDGLFWEESWGDERAVPPEDAARGEPAARPEDSRAGGFAAARTGLPSAVRITLALAPPRRGAAAAGERPAGDEGGADEPGASAPLVFRTTVHLNLAERESSRGRAAALPAGSAGPSPAATGGR